MTPEELWSASVIARKALRNLRHQDDEFVRGALVEYALDHLEPVLQHLEAAMNLAESGKDAVECPNP